MREFDQRLLRLKAALGVTSDQDVAAALGLSKAAFSDRKRRDAFPEDALWALAQKEPKRRLNVYQVLTGKDKETESAAMGVVTAQLRLAMSMVPGDTEEERMSRAMELVEAVTQGMPADEQMLLDGYRALDAAAKKRLLGWMLAGAPEQPAASSGLSQTMLGPVSGTVAGRDVIGRDRRR